MLPITNHLLADNIGRGLFLTENAADEATIYLYDVIVNDSSWGGISAIDFVRELAAAQVGTIHLRINSPGGEVFAAQAMVQAVKEHPAKVVAHIDGLAASSASWLALSADEVHIASGGMIMIHQAMTYAVGNAKDMHATAAMLEKIDRVLVDLYVEATGQTEERIAEWMAAETWFSAQEAVDAGFASSIATAEAKNLKAWNLSSYANAPPMGGSDKKSPDSHSPDNAHRHRLLSLSQALFD